MAGVARAVEEAGLTQEGRVVIGSAAAVVFHPVHQVHPIQIVAAVLHRAALRVAMVVEAAVVAAPVAVGDSIGNHPLKKGSHSTGGGWGEANRFYINQCVT